MIIKQIPRISKLDVLFSGSAGHREDLTVFFAQLLAWKKLSQHGELETELRYPEAIDPNLSIFKVYSQLSRLAAINPAFHTKESALESLRNTTFRRIFELVETYTLEGMSYETVSGIFETANTRQSETVVLSPALSELMVGVAEVKRKDKVLAAFEGSEWIAFKAAEISTDVSIYMRQPGPIPYLLNILLDRKVEILSTPFAGDVFSDKVDVIFSTASMAEPIDNLRELWSRHFRRLVLMVPQNFLYRTAGDAFYMKQEMVDTGMLKAVLSLNPAVLPIIKKECGLLVIGEPNDDTDILLVDTVGVHGATGIQNSRESEAMTVPQIINVVNSHAQIEGLSVVANEYECEKLEYNLSPDRYLTTDKERTVADWLERLENVQLEDLADFYRPQSNKEFEIEDGDDYFEVSVSDIGEDGFVNIPTSKIVMLDLIFKNRHSDRCLRPLDILLPIKGSVGKIGLVPKQFDGKLLANQSMIVLRLKDTNKLISPIVLYHYLASPIGQQLLQSRTSGAVIPFIQMKDVRKIPVLIPPVELQKQIEVQHSLILDNLDRIQSTRAEIAFNREEITKLFVQEA